MFPLCCIIREIMQRSINAAAAGNATAALPEHNVDLVKHARFLRRSIFHCSGLRLRSFLPTADIPRRY